MTERAPSTSNELTETEQASQQTTDRELFGDGHDHEADEELQGELALADQRATALEQVLHQRMRSHTEQVSGETVNVGEVKVGDDAVVKQVEAPDGHATVIELQGNGAGSVIVVKHDPPQVTIDGREADLAGVEAALKVIGELGNAKTSPEEADEAEGADNESSEEVTDKPEKSEQEKQAAAKVKQMLAPYFGGQAGRAVQDILAQVNINPGEARARLAQGDITIDAQTMAAMNRLRQAGAQPNSPVWAENPRGSSMLARAAAESRQLMAEALRSALR